jgi:hypothetical protein
MTTFYLVGQLNRCPVSHLSTRSRACRISAFTARASSRNICRCPPRQAFLDVASLPSIDLGPVDSSHGLQVRISSACRALRSNVQPLPMVSLQ